MCWSPKRCLSTTAGFRQALTASLCVPISDEFLFRFQKLDVPLHRSWCAAFTYLATRLHIYAFTYLATRLHIYAFTYLAARLHIYAFTYLATRW